MPKIVMIRRSLKLAVSIILLLTVDSKMFGQNHLPNKQDKVIGDFDNNGIEDTLFVSYINNGISGFNVKLRFLLSLSNGIKSEIGKTTNFEIVTYYPRIYIDKSGYLIIGETIDRVMNEYNCTIYKYFNQKNDWYCYGSFSQKYNIGSSNLFGERLYESSKSFAIGDSVRQKLPKVEDSIIQVFNEDYNAYLYEYKSKKYDKIHLHDMYKTLDYLNYVEINKNTVQKYNDIGFFLLEAKEYEQAINILENVVYKYPNRAVAYLNFGDAYWGLDEKEYAKNAYQKYIELMKADGKETKIPHRVFERVK